MIYDQFKINRSSQVRWNRRSLRLKGYDYSQAGAYFITLCAKNRECLFGKISEGEMKLNEVGEMIGYIWEGLPARFSLMDSDEFIIMPNHFHAILVLHPSSESFHHPASTIHNPGDHKDRPYGTLPDTLGRIVQAYKSLTTLEYIKGVKQYRWDAFHGKIWQRNYWEHVIRDEYELVRIREYIINNPMNWESDRENPDSRYDKGYPQECTVKAIGEAWFGI